MQGIKQSWDSCVKTAQMHSYRRHHTDYIKINKYLKSTYVYYNKGNIIKNLSRQTLNTEHYLVKQSVQYGDARAA